MNAKTWTTWEKYLPAANVQIRAKAVALCLKPWDQILPEEGIEERMNSREFWNTWERYLHLERSDTTADVLIDLRVKRPEKILV
jgi:hypothetical protein